MGCLQAWLAAISPGRSSCAHLPTPAVQGLLQQLRMRTPALGPQVTCPLLEVTKLLSSPSAARWVL